MEVVSISHVRISRGGLREFFGDGIGWDVSARGMDVLGWTGLDLNMHGDQIINNSFADQ